MLTDTEPLSPLEQPVEVLQDSIAPMPIIKPLQTLDLLDLSTTGITPSSPSTLITSKEEEGKSIIAKSENNNDAIVEPEPGSASSSTANNTDDESSLIEEPKHQLQSAWKFWYFEASKERAWEDCLKVVSPFETVEDFWSIYNHIKSASDLRTGCSYSVFKDGIKPMWEDAGNRAGGRWLVNFDKRQRQHNLDNYWLEVLLCLIGEAFDEDGDDICGAVVDCRMKQDKVAIWTANCAHKDAIWNIGRKIKERLGLAPQSLVFESHEATASKTGSMVKPLFVL